MNNRPLLINQLVLWMTYNLHVCQSLDQKDGIFVLPIGSPSKNSLIPWAVTKLKDGNPVRFQLYSSMLRKRNLLSNHPHPTRTKRNLMIPPETASQIASKMPLLHVSGNEKNGRLSFTEILFSANPVLPTSEEQYNYCSDITRATEGCFALGPCLYFYAGRAHPDFGEISLAFAAGCEDRHYGSATPFDSGGLYNGKIKSKLDTASSKRIYVFNQRVPLDVWRDSFSMFLTSWFDTPEDYWFGTPCIIDDEDLLNATVNHWRAWTYEVRFNDPHNVFGAVKWCATEPQTEKIRRLAIDSGQSSDNDLVSFMQRILVPNGHPDFCNEIEKWVREVVEL